MAQRKRWAEQKAQSEPAQPAKKTTPAKNPAVSKMSSAGRYLPDGWRHKPGEMVRLRSLAFRDGGHAAANEPVTLTVTDPDNKILVKTALKTNRFGIAAYDWKTSEQTPTGDYEAKFDLDNIAGSGGEITQEVLNATNCRSSA